MWTPDSPVCFSTASVSTFIFLYMVHFEKHGGECKDKTACEIYSCAMYTIRVYSFLNYAYMWTIYLCNIQPNKTALTRDTKKKHLEIFGNKTVTPEEMHLEKKKVTGLARNRNSSSTARRRLYQHILITMYSTKIKKKNDLKRNTQAWRVSESQNLKDGEGLIHHPVPASANCELTATRAKKKKHSLLPAKNIPANTQ